MGDGNGLLSFFVSVYFKLVFSFLGQLTVTLTVKTIRGLLCFTCTELANISHKIDVLMFTH